MKAYAISKPFETALLEIEEPVPGPTDVVLDVKYLGLCGSDLNSYRGLMPFVTYPRIPGHEISGIITDKGKAVPASLEIGVKATVSPYTHCGVCPACRQGRVNACEFNQTLGVQSDGALTEKIAVSYEKIHSCNNLSLKELALVEPLSVGYHGVNRGRVTETDKVLVIGCGTIGIGAICGAFRKGATVIAADVDDAKLGMAKKFGAAYAVNSKTTDLKVFIAEFTQNEGVDVVVEAVGATATFEVALELVAFAGRVVTIGYSKQPAQIETQINVRKELDILGSRNALRVFPSVISMFERKERPFTDIITQIYAFDKTPDAFADWDKNPGKVSKILIEL
ncbi:MAG: zinc-binding alcohol dehydrogenase family protein [Deltaproteobacteria bacterium]|nr:zinc-binding alcohol dehydrogenase family protein [Deltaproteobacteria bacterium]